MYDASAKFPTGILSGKSTDFGDYDECLETNTTGLGFKSQYCIVKIHFSPSEKLYPDYYKIASPNLTSSVSVWEAVKVCTNFRYFILIYFLLECKSFTYVTLQAKFLFTIIWLLFFELALTSETIFVFFFNIMS